MNFYEMINMFVARFITKANKVGMEPYIPAPISIPPIKEVDLFEISPQILTPSHYLNSEKYRSKKVCWADKVSADKLTVDSRTI